MNEEDAQKLVAAGVKIVAEGANMPSDPEAIQVYHAKVGSHQSLHQYIPVPCSIPIRSLPVPALAKTTSGDCRATHYLVVYRTKRYRSAGSAQPAETY